MNKDATNILVAKNISKRYVGVQALDNVSVTIKKGEIKCLAGENGCGKSTFVKIIAGVETPDSGEIDLNGKQYNKLNVINAINEGVQVIYQDLSLFEHLTVAENIAMNKMIKEKKKYVSKKEIHEISKKALNLIGVEIDLDTTIQQLSIANKQIVAICRALTLDAKILFMDEPTTTLTKKEVDRLLGIVIGLKEKGISIVFISHKLDEVMKIADSITIFRDGKLTGDFDCNEIDQKKLIYHMTGRNVAYSNYVRDYKDDEQLLEIKNLSKQGNYRNFNLKIRRGDIIGLTGLLGAGRTELALSLFGLNKPDEGKIIFKGKEIQIDSPLDAIKNNIVLLPEDRSTQGLFLNQSVKDNMICSIMDSMLNKFKLLDTSRHEEVANECIERFKIRTYKSETIIKTLSGGNQQKAVLAKWVVTDPELLILDTPTVGIDVGSKAEIYDQIQALAREGMSIILISDEVEEIVANCNKVKVVYEGESLIDFDEEDMKQADISTKISHAIESGIDHDSNIISQQVGGSRHV